MDILNKKLSLLNHIISLYIINSFFVFLILRFNYLKKKKLFLHITLKYK